MLVLVYKNGDMYIGEKEFFLDKKNKTFKLGEETLQLNDVTEIVVDGRVIYGDTNESF
jgi:hypothetical protein